MDKLLIKLEFTALYNLNVRLWPRGVPTPSTDIGLPPLLAAISPLSTDLRDGWTNNVGTVDLLQVMWRNGQPYAIPLHKSCYIKHKGNDRLTFYNVLLNLTYLLNSIIIF